MIPDGTATDAAVSEDVATVTPTDPAVTLPMTKPDSVTTNDEAETAAPAEVMTTDVLVVAVQVPVKPATLLLQGCTVGVDVAKNPDG